MVRPPPYPQVFLIALLALLTVGSQPPEEPCDWEPEEILMPALVIHDADEGTIEVVLQLTLRADVSNPVGFGGSLVSEEVRELTSSEGEPTGQFATYWDFDLEPDASNFHVEFDLVDCGVAGTEELELEGVSSNWSDVRYRWIRRSPPSRSSSRGCSLR